MVRPEGKLKTRKSTLGASKKDRISSATQRSSICTRSVYGGNHQRTPIRRVGGLRIEPREGKVPKSITTTTTATTTNSSNSNNNNNVEVGTKNSTRSSRSSISGNDTRDSPPPSPLDARPLMDFGHGTSNKLQTSTAKPAKPARAVAVVSPLVSSSKSLNSNSNINCNSNTNSNSNSSRENKEYVERIEMVAMKNGKDQSFIRILTNKLSSKPKKQQQQDDAILVQLPSSRALRRAKKNKKEKDGDKSNSPTITATAATATATAVTFAAAVTFADDTEHTSSKEASSLVETTTKTKTRKSKRYTPPILATIDSMELQELELCGHLDEMESTLGGCPIGCSTPPQFNNNSNNQNNSYNFNGKHRKSSTAALFDNIPEIAHSLAETTASAALQAKYSSSGNGNGNGDDNNGAASPLKQEKAFTKT